MKRIIIRNLVRITAEEQKYEVYYSVEWMVGRSGSVLVYVLGLQLQVNLICKTLRTTNSYYLIRNQSHFYFYFFEKKISSSRQKTFHY
jgi:hypothetical protein